MTGENLGNVIVNTALDEAGYAQQRRIEKNWAGLYHFQLNNLPVIAPSFEHPPDYKFVPEEPVTIPLTGGGQLEIGCREEHYLSTGKDLDDKSAWKSLRDRLVIGVKTASYRSTDQEENKGLDFSVSIDFEGRTALLDKTREVIDIGDANYLEGNKTARNYLALFDPEKDINWNTLENPTPQQQNVLSKLNFHPPAKSGNRS